MRALFIREPRALVLGLLLAVAGCNAGSSQSSAGVGTSASNLGGADGTSTCSYAGAVGASCTTNCDCESDAFCQSGTCTISCTPWTTRTTSDGTVQLCNQAGTEWDTDADPFCGVTGTPPCITITTNEGCSQYYRLGYDTGTCFACGALAEPECSDNTCQNGLSPDDSGTCMGG